MTLQVLHLYTLLVMAALVAVALLGVTGKYDKDGKSLQSLDTTFH